MGSDEESGKDWSDLEREAAEEDKDRITYEDYKGSGKGTSSKRNGGDNHRRRESHSSPKKHKSSSHHNSNSSHHNSHKSSKHR